MANWIIVYIFFFLALCIFNNVLLKYRLDNKKVFVAAIANMLLMIISNIVIDKVSHTFFVGNFLNCFDRIHYFKIVFSCLFLAVFVFELGVIDKIKYVLSSFFESFVSFLVIIFSFDWIIDGEYFYLFFIVSVVAFKAKRFYNVVKLDIKKI